jgi:hypothetical protein
MMFFVGQKRISYAGGIATRKGRVKNNLRILGSSESYPVLVSKEGCRSTGGIIFDLPFLPFKYPNRFLES